MTDLLTLWWGCVAVLAYVMVWALVTHALRPKPGTWQTYPDWFWDPKSGWEWSIRWVGDDAKREQSDRPASEPESGAG